MHDAPCVAVEAEHLRARPVVVSYRQRKQRIATGREAMKVRKLAALTTALLGSAALTPVTAFAAPSLPTCSQLATLLAANAYITQTSSDNEGIPSPTASIVAATSKNAAYCNVQFQFSAW